MGIINNKIKKMFISNYSVDQKFGKMLIMNEPLVNGSGGSRKWLAEGRRRLVTRFGIGRDEYEYGFWLLAD